SFRRSSMNTRAGTLLKIMQDRLQMQIAGVTSPPESNKALTKSLVEKLSRVDHSEKINIILTEDKTVRYILVSTGEILGEFTKSDT
ncbi:hypothetical protein ACGLQO_004310, partial [Vibrio vulnificus]|nr:hypothetical protein [Vibrio vulnificus]